MLLAATVPIPVFAALTPILHLPASTLTYNVLFALSTAHGGLSGLFWIDARYRRYLGTNRRRFYGTAAWIAGVGLIGTLLLGQDFLSWFVAFYLAWTAVHFSRQNWGVICLAASSLGGSRPSQLENLACHVASAGGGIGVIAGIAPALGLHGPGLRMFAVVGLSLVIAAFACSVVVAMRLIGERAPLLRVGITLSIGVFFMPIYLFGPVIGFTCVGLTHAIQYALIMFLLAGDNRQGSRFLRVGGTLLSAALYILTFYALQDHAFWGSWSGVATVVLYSVVMWHFLLDSELFRLRNAVPRNIVKESLPFLFPKVAPQMVPPESRHSRSATSALSQA